MWLVTGCLVSSSPHPVIKGTRVLKATPDVGGQGASRGRIRNVLFGGSVTDSE